jgi:hypothetical protein
MELRSEGYSFLSIFYQRFAPLVHFSRLFHAPEVQNVGSLFKYIIKIGA